MGLVFTGGGSITLYSRGGNFPDTPTDFSIAFWLYRTATFLALEMIGGPGDGGLNGISLQVLANNTIEVNVGYTTTSKIRNSVTAAPLNAWIHVVIVHQNNGLASTDITFYFNGIVEAGTDGSTAVGTRTVNQTMTFGCDLGIAFGSAPINLGPLAIWSRALSPTEALALAIGAHPTRFREGLIEVYGTENGGIDLGFFGILPLVVDTGPISVVVNPPIEPPVIWPQIAGF